MKSFLALLALSALTVFTVGTLRAAPVNDNFADRIALSGTTVTTTGSNVGATTQTGEPSRIAGSRFSYTVWWTWTAPASGAVQIDTIGSSFDTLLGVYTGSLGSFSLVADNNNAPGMQNVSLINFTAQQGTQYQILVAGPRFFNNTGTIQLSVKMSFSASINSPANGSLFAFGAPIPITATASSPNGTISRVDFYHAGSLVGTDSEAPFTSVVTNAPLGTNQFFVVATDSTSMAITSSVVNVAVMNPGVAITAPVDGATYQNTNAIPVSALALSAAGSITNVSFFTDGTKFGEDLTSPYSASWTSVTPGMHALTAIGRDNAGNAYTSAPVLIAVARTLVATGAVWKYLDDGSDQGTAWTASSFEDQAWLSGPGPLGYGDANGIWPATTNSWGPNESSKFTTTYYRRTFPVEAVSSYSNLLVRVQRDDGVIVYLNGTEIFRQNMAAGPITYTSFSATTVGTGDETTWYSADVSALLVEEGENVLAAEVHQCDLTSSDIWFNLELLGMPLITRNRAPIVQVTSPTNTEYFVSPVDVPIATSATDADGSVAKVEFYVDGAKLGESTNSPFSFVWSNAPVGWHVLRAVATDNEGASGTSAQVAVTVYDAAVTPLVQITSPAHGAVYQGPTNFTISALATAAVGVTNVQFRSNGEVIGADATSPYSFVWLDAAFGTNALTAVAYDAQGRSGTSAPISVIVNTPPVNSNAPAVFSVNPAAGAGFTNLSTIQVIFTENVVGVDAGDLLVNGTPATKLSGSGSNYTFTVGTPAGGLVTVIWAPGHGITDIGWPAALPFDETAPGATWTYTMLDLVPPTIVSQSPPAGAIVADLTSITVTFSEPVINVNASDLLIHGAPAIGLSGGPVEYTFSFPPPTTTNIAISWAIGHGITDLATPPNPFNATGPGARWAYKLDTRTMLVASNADFRYFKGRSEASTPAQAWRASGFDDSAWLTGQAPFYFDDDGGPPPNPAFTGNTLLNDMMNSYRCVFLRRPFVVANAAVITNIYVRFRCDDGFVAWINGVEVTRYGVSGEPTYLTTAASAAEPLVTNTVTLLNPTNYLVEGTNVLAIQLFNSSLDSSDLLLESEFYTYLTDPTTVPPRVFAVSPAAGDVFYLTNITVTFTEAVRGVQAGNLLVNGVGASSVSNTTDATYTFSFPPPPYGLVSLTWAGDTSITDLDPMPKAFNPTAPGATWQYTFLNPSAPVVASQSPLADSTIYGLTELTVNFSEPVDEVDASDLLVNGQPATGFSGAGASVTFTFPQPPYGPVTIGWAPNHHIQDFESPPNLFDETRPGSTWTYTLVDQTPPAIASQDPPAGAQVTNLTQVTVTFTEPVTGVNASDLLINGAPAAGYEGSGTTYTFTFLQPNASIVNVTWANNHGIRDLAPVPNSFNNGALGSAWSYTTPDNLPPTVVTIDPPRGATVRSLTQITVLFAEPVSGVDTNDLMVNGLWAIHVSGSGAGPYTFLLPPQSNGPVDVRWADHHGITDLASIPNDFVGDPWNYVIDPNASFADKIVINEIMFNPLSGQEADEWIELRNLADEPINLTGWRFTRGLDYTFPNVNVPARGYLVVAADAGAFQTQYPGVTNVVGGWVGRLANNDETIELVTLLGERVDSVHYAAEGDWGLREQGRGAKLVTGITRSGTTATVRIFGHDYTAGDVVMISGADQPQYNGRFVVASPTSDSFNITVTGSPASPATGVLVCRMVLDNNASGWSWYSAADGFGSSLELVNPALPHDEGQNWLCSTNLFGTPGAANSVAQTNAAPLITGVRHSPAVPQSTDPVTITARVWDEHSNGVANVTLYYRSHSTPSPAAFSALAMTDDGLNGDAAAQDGLYSVTLGNQPNRTVMEFYVQAEDTLGLIRTWPAPAWQTNNTFAQTANALYQVSDESSATNMPFLRVIMTETERSLLANINTASDAEMNATFISVDGDGTTVRYNTGIRLRGAGSRSGQPKNYRVNFASDRRWNNVSEINLNCRYPHPQLAGSVLAQKAGLPAAEARVVQLRLNGDNTATAGSVNYGCYLLVEPIGAEWAANHFPLDPDGNVYRGSKYPWNANLDYLGTNAATYYGQTGAGYYKTSNRGENDWTDLFRLTYALSPSTPDDAYVQAVSTNVNVEAWLLYFVVCNFFDYQETALCRGVGDDFAMYRGIKDPRFRLLGHDFDTILGQGDAAGSTTRSIWVMIDNPATTTAGQQATFLRRFMRHPEFAPIYFRLWKQHLDTTFTPQHVNPLLDQMLGSWVPGDVVTAMKTFAASRRNYVLTQIPLALTVQSSLNTQNGYLRTTSSSVILNGQSHIIDTRRVLVNGAAATWSAWEGRWTNTVALQPGINRVLVQSVDSNNVVFASTNLDLWYDDGSVQAVSGTISTDTTWNAASGPYNITGNLTIASGATLTIPAGTTVYLGSGVNLIVANGGRLLAEGTATAPIRFTRAPGASTTWGGLTINGGASSPETRLAYAHFEYNGSTAIHSVSGTVFLDHLTFGNPAVQYVSLDSSSFVVQDCTFPATTASFEPVHGTGGIRAGGRGIFLRNFFGPITGYNDTIDFSGGQRPGPILQVIQNVFMGTGDDFLDLDNTDAWVEGNLFLHAHKNGSPDTSSAVSGGDDAGTPSDITILGNLIYDCDHAANAKQGNFYTMLNNTIVRQTHVGGLDTEGAVLVLADNNMTEGRGIFLEGNIISEAESLTRDWTNALVTYTNNIIHQLAGTPWTGPGGGNVNVDPLFKYLPAVAETTNFTSWAAAQVLWDWFSLRSGSPALGAGPNGSDAGGGIARGVSISGVPSRTTPANSAILSIGVNRTGSGITAAGWPNGSGYTHYKWRLDGGIWSAETPLSTPIALSNLVNGPHSVEVVGKNDAGFYQDDPAYGPAAVVTVSRTWTVDPTVSPLRLNEILASNGGAVNHYGTTPDLIELYNEAREPLDLTGVRLTDDPLNPDKFVFPVGAFVPAQGYLVVCANDPDGTPGYHLGFNLSQVGEGVYLYAPVVTGGELLDSVTFGAQLADLSIGRLADGSWALTVPTFGAANRSAPLANPAAVRINEWLALGQSLMADDFIELYNPQLYPVALGGLYLSDEPLGWPARHSLAPLSFLAGYGYQQFIADGNASLGPNHLNFALSGDQGMIGLYLPDLTPVDCVIYGPQTPGVSQGRSPNASSNIVFLTQVTPGGPNPYVTVAPPPLVVPIFSMSNAWRYEETGANLGTAWREPAYDDSAWPSGPGLLAAPSGGLTSYGGELVRTLLTTNTSKLTFYFRTAFVAPTNGTITGLQVTHILDDGAVFYLNGQECLRVNMAGGAVDYNTLAVNSVGTASLQGPAIASAFALQPGTNVLAVEVHQINSTSSDLVFGITLDALVVTNSTAAGSVVLNEILASNASYAEADGSTPDWVELYNQSGGLADLSDMSLSDAANQQRRFVFPAGTRLAPGAYLRIRCDGGAPASTTNTGFGLKTTGGALYFFDSPANGGSLIDAVVYGLQVADFSLGRAPNGSTNWTLTLPTPAAANLAVASLGNPANLRVNEWMADPVSGEADWFEIYNADPQPVALGGLHLTDDLNSLTKFRIAALSFIGVGTNAWQGFVADGNTGAGADHVSFSLRAAGEAVGIASTNGVLIDGVAFGQQQENLSQGRFPNGANNVVSFPGTASPGESNYRWLTDVVVNEVLTHTDLPLEDAIELHNLTGQPIDIGGWWLSDDPGTLRKYQIPGGTVLPAYGFTVIYETQFTNRELAAIPFALSSQGDEVVLSPAANNELTGFRTSVKFGAAANGVSFGRYVTSDQREEFVALSARTFGVDDPDSVEKFRQGTGATNAYPWVGPVVISEIMYHPPDLGTNDNVQDEFIELHNISTVTVPLYDTLYPSNTWRLRDAVDFDFPPNTEIPAGGYLLVVSFDPANDAASLAAFRDRYNLDFSVPILGPFIGKLANNSDDIELRRPDTPDFADVPSVLVERVRYSDSAPWPALADGTGLSLQRVNNAEFGNDPANWTAANPTPGPSALPFDADHDGMLDSWEIAHGLDPYNPADAGLDSDGDGLINLQEYLAGTDPRDAHSVLRFEAVSLGLNGTNLVLSFTAVSNLTYTVEFSDTLAAGTWQGFYDVEAAPTNRFIQISVPAPAPMRFYRVRTPWRLAASPSLRIDAIQPGAHPDEMLLTFMAPANLGCTVEYLPSLAAGAWTTITNYPAAPTTRLIQVSTPASGTSGFYRLRSP